MIELFQLLPSGDIVSLGGTAQAEGEVTTMLEKYPGMDIHAFFGTRVIAECDPPTESDLDEFDINEAWDKVFGPNGQGF